VQQVAYIANATHLPRGVRQPSNLVRTVNFTAQDHNTILRADVHLAFLSITMAEYLRLDPVRQGDVVDGAPVPVMAQMRYSMRDSGELPGPITNLLADSPGTLPDGC